ncbi:MAG: serine/threonine protein kinase [Leptospirales bacterium]
MQTEPDDFTDTSEYFFRLTPDVVMDAVEEAGLYPSGHCRALNSLENRVFDIGLDDGSHIVAKFYRPGRWNDKQILEEHKFLVDLRDDEVPVLFPLPFPNGSTISQRKGIYYAIWPFSGGREPAEFSDTELEIVGRLIARIHNTGAGSAAPERPALSSKRMGLEPYNFLVENRFIPPELTNRYEYAVKKTVEVYDKLSEDIPTHRIHGDCHLGNLLFGTHGWYFLDFDDFSEGPAVQDIWLIVSERDEDSDRRLNIFLDAYRTFRDFDDRWLMLLEPLRTLRYIHYTSWIARRWKDPSFPAAFPHFGDNEFWIKEVNDLEHQLTLYAKPDASQIILENNPLSNSTDDAPKEEEPLTNKDFFWDME